MTMLNGRKLKLFTNNYAHIYILIQTYNTHTYIFTNMYLNYTPPHIPLLLTASRPSHLIPFDFTAASRPAALGKFNQRVTMLLTW